jgi:hypothetical protein
MARTTRSFFALVAVASLALAGCASDGSVDGDASSSGDVALDESGAAIDNSSVAALTGVEIEPGSLAKPAFSAKIDNAPMARPQVGLDAADIVFEELVEYGVTRYIGVWHSNVPSEIGPIRSVRPMDPEIVSPFGGVFAYFGGQVRFIQMMQSAPVYNIILGQKDTEDLYYRSTAKPAPHNVIVKPNELIAQHLDLPAPQPQFDYAPSVEESTAVVGGQPLQLLKTVLSDESRPYWEWDSTQGKFLRFQTNTAADVASNGNQLAADNVVVLFVAIDVIENIPTTRLVSQGKGWVASGGSIIEVNWIKATPESPIVLSTAGGEDVLLAQGQTWVQLLPNDTSDVPAGSVTIE